MDALKDFSANPSVIAPKVLVSKCPSVTLSESEHKRRIHSKDEGEKMAKLPDIAEAKHTLNSLAAQEVEDVFAEDLPEKSPILESQLDEKL